MTTNNPPFSDAPSFTTPVFDENTLPAQLQKEHRTKAGTWGLICVLEGQIRYEIAESGVQTILEPGKPGIIKPEQLHHVTPIGPVKMQVEFYSSPPKTDS